MRNSDSFKDPFWNGLNQLDQRVFHATAEKHAREFKAQSKTDDSDVFTYVLEKIQSNLTSLEKLSQRNARFNRRIRMTQSGPDRHQLIIDYAEELGASPKELRGDRQSLNRYLDAEALNDRFARIVGNTERDTIYLLGRMGKVFIALHLSLETSQHSSTSHSGERIDSLQRWRNSAANKLLEVLLFYTGDDRVKVTAMNTVTAVLQCAHPELRSGLLNSNIKQLIFRVSLDSHQGVQLQKAAIESLVFYSPEEFSTVAQRRKFNEISATETSPPADDFFIRARIATLLFERNERLPQAQKLIEVYAQDVSDFVRQETVKSAFHLSPEAAANFLAERIARENNDIVRASAILELPKLLELSTRTAHTIRSFLGGRFTEEQSELCLRCMLDVVPSITSYLSRDADQERVKTWFETFEPLISELHINTANLKIRRWSANSREHLWVQSHPDIQKQFVVLKSAISALPLGKRKSLSLPPVTDLSKENLGRVLSVIAQDDYGLDIEPKPNKLRITRWYDFRFRLWRFLYELKHSTTDKRQGHKHMSGRVFYGSMSIASNRLAEQTQTKVPGEPLYITAEDGPRNYLPLIDELISSLDQGWPTQAHEIYTSEGITSIHPPTRVITRLRARIKLIWHYDTLSRLRNWSSDMSENESAYLSKVADLGFTFSLRGYTDSNGNSYPPHPSLKRFFPDHGLAAITLPSIGLLWNDIKEYFFSVYSNSILQLWIFLAGFFALFIGKHAFNNHQMNRARASIPLSIGGWGTRGKSGTERLKAAVFNGLGLRVISKTTGCEAMFLEGNAHQNLKEMFLFRPYDKATIWEQVNLVKLASKLNTDVFLWECMGLTPAYVHILQKHWMRDDIATITNTYPDHEDVQGPAGIDIPEVMTQFIPRDSTLVTSEEIMYPILRESAQSMNTDCIPVTWRETNTITKDILERFPYEEHPNNIALVTSMAAQLGIDRSFSLKAMADNVVLDLGVLKTYPATQVNGRTLQYVMGNSANERLGALGNWRRMGFDQHDIESEPDIWVSTIVNNRADRVPRSKVFASILVNDVSADRHLIIGSNVEGFETFLNEAWEETFASYSIWRTSEGERHDIQVSIDNCSSTAERFRVPITVRQICARLKVMLNALGITLSDNQYALLIDANESNISHLLEQHDLREHRDSILSCVEQWQAECIEYNQIVSKLASLNPDQANREFIDFIKTCFFSRVDFLYDSLATGEEIIQQIATSTPVGMTNRIMGMQNIKGTGLDFVYRWQAWERCHKACEQLMSDDERELTEALRELRAFEEYGSLSSNYVVAQLEEHRSSPPLQAESMQSDIHAIIEKIEMQRIQDNDYDALDPQAAELSKWRELIVNFLEQFLDLGDAVKRRKHADQIYRDLASYRISRSRAEVELQALTKRQKGGWLKKKLS